MAQNHPSVSASSLPGKAETQHTEFSRTLTIQELPDAAKAEGGILLNAECLDGQSSLRLASDGHVSLICLSLYTMEIVLTNYQLRPYYFLSQPMIRTIHSTGRGRPNI
jgi:hypothetical protein